MAYIIRLISFGLACLLCGAVCFGLSVAIIAGIAYGYNYCMAEFITFTRQDVSVYMRRGQFYDRINIPIHRRSNSEEDDIMKRSDYEEPQRSMSAPERPLSETWMKAQDTRKYAERLTKYSPPGAPDNAFQRIEANSFPETRKNINYPKVPETPLISIMPQALVPTETWRSGTSEIVMRKFKPLQDVNSGNTAVNLPEELFPSTDPSLALGGLRGPKESLKIKNDRSYNNQLREWETTARSVIPEYVTEDIEEDVVYKPV